MHTIACEDILPSKTKLIQATCLVPGISRPYEESGLYKYKIAAVNLAEDVLERDARQGSTFLDLGSAKGLC